jgi:hypothetical protein
MAVRRAKDRGHRKSPAFPAIFAISETKLQKGC